MTPYSHDISYCLASGDPRSAKTAKAAAIAERSSVFKSWQMMPLWRCICTRCQYIYFQPQLLALHTAMQSSWQSTHALHGMLCSLSESHRQDCIAKIAGFARQTWALYAADLTLYHVPLEIHAVLTTIQKIVQSIYLQHALTLEVACMLVSFSALSILHRCLSSYY